MAAGRGAQVILDGVQQQLARGGAGLSLVRTMEAKRALEYGGTVSTGLTPDGSSPLGVPAEDVVLAPEGTDPGGVPPLADVIALATRITAMEALVVALEQQVATLTRRLTVP